MSPKIKLNSFIFELTGDCNQQCKFCYNHWKGDDKPSWQERPSYLKARKVLKKIFSQAKVDSVSFSGGEPMIFERINDLLLTTKFHKAQVSVLTNGTLLNDFNLEIFWNLDISRVQIPILSANPSIHDGLTQLLGSWEKSVSAAKKILSQHPDKFTTVLVLTKQNLPDLEQTLAFYHKLGIKSVLINRFNIGGLGRKYNDELKLSHKELQSAFSIINDSAKVYPVVYKSGVCTPICVLDPANFPHINFSFCNKNVSSRPITINYNGDVRFCNHSPNVLGNVFEKSLYEILYDEKLNNYFDFIPEFCSSCDVLKICGGGCRAASEQVYNTFTKADPLVDK